MPNSWAAWLNGEIHRHRAIAGNSMHCVKDVVVAYADSGPTLLWVLLLAGVLFFGRKHWARILRSVAGLLGRIKNLKFKGLELEFGEMTKGALSVQPLPRGSAQMSAVSSGLAVALEEERKDRADRQRGVHLVHVALPSAKPGQTHDVLISLAGGVDRSTYPLSGDRKYPADLSDVTSATFQLGAKFEPSTITVENDGHNKLQVQTSLYGPFLCVCEVTFADGDQQILTRFIDLEAAHFTERALDLRD